MTRHIIDKSRERKPSVMAQKFISIDRDSAPHDASQRLQKRPKQLTGSGRMREFLRIERGVRA